MVEGDLGVEEVKGDLGNDAMAMVRNKGRRGFGVWSGRRPER